MTITLPQILRDSNIEGTVYVQFVINVNGEVKDTRIIRGLHPALDEISINAVESLPKFIPGMQDGKRVNVQLVVPIKFEIR